MESQSTHSQNFDPERPEIHFHRKKEAHAPLTPDGAAEKLLELYRRGERKTFAGEIEQFLHDPLVPRRDPLLPDLPKRPLLATIKPPLFYAFVALLAALGIAVFLYLKG